MTTSCAHMILAVFDRINVFSLFIDPFMCI